MGMADTRARFSALQATDGTVAAVIRDACQEAAEKINASVQGESTELQAVLQMLEQAAHVGLRAFRTTDVAEQPDTQQEAPGANAAKGSGAADSTGAPQARAKTSRSKAKVVPDEGPDPES